MFISIPLNQSLSAPENVQEIILEINGTPFDIFYRSMKSFIKIYGHCQVPIDFTIPKQLGFHTMNDSVVLNSSANTNNWPREAVGLPLGRICSKVRRQGVAALFLTVGKNNLNITVAEVNLPDTLALLGTRVLEHLGVAFGEYRDKKFEVICQALVVHQRLFGDM